MNKIVITINSYINDKFFNKGEEYTYSGTERVQEGCSCNGSLKEYDTYVIFINNVKYNIRKDHAELVPQNCNVK